jgi:hypothetical protein
MSLREVMGGAFDADDLSTKIWESDVDRIAAMGFTSRLGSLLWRLKYANDHRAYKPAVLVLAKKAKSGFPIGMRLCELALREWCMPQCEVCRGAKEIMVEDLRIVCKGCDGIGVRRYTSREREAAAGLPVGSWRGWAKKYGFIWETMTDAERRVNVCLNIQLDRLAVRTEVVIIEPNSGACAPPK